MSEVISEELIGLFKNALNDEVLEIKTESLKDAETPAILLLSEEARRMQEMSAYYGMDFGQKPKSTLILNTENALIKMLPAISDEQRAIACRYICSLATLSHRTLTADEMSDFVRLSLQVLTIAVEK